MLKRESSVIIQRQGNSKKKTKELNHLIEGLNLQQAMDDQNPAQRHQQVPE